jgi:uncharacterized membrane protein
MMLTATMIAVIASRYLMLDPATYFEDQKAVYMRRETILVLHVAASLVALLVGPWQFVTRLREKSIKIHRAVGFIFVAGCMIGGTAGLALATTAHGGAVASGGFMALGCLWLATTALALRSIYHKDVPSHWRWMVRSYSLCFAAVTLRLYLGTFEGLDAAGLTQGITFTEAYVVIAWLCWVPNLAIGWWISTGPSPSQRTLLAGAKQ